MDEFVLHEVASKDSNLTWCERQHKMYEHLPGFFQYFDGVSNPQNLSLLMKQDPCFLPMLEQNSTMPSSEWIENFDFWCSGILINLIGVIGILGNSLSLIILSRPQMRSSINYLLVALARCDIILIITSMFLFGFHSIYPYSYNDETGGSMFWFRYTYNVYPRIIKYLFTLAVIAQTANCYLTLLVSLERYVAVCHPLRAVSDFLLLQNWNSLFLPQKTFYMTSIYDEIAPNGALHIEIKRFQFSFPSWFLSMHSARFVHIWTIKILCHVLYDCCCSL